MEAVMRLCSISWLALGVWFVMVAADCSPALSQIEFAESTIRFRSGPAPAAAKSPAATLAQPEIVSTPSAAGKVRVAAEPPAAPIVRHAVRQAAYEAPVVAQAQGQPQMPSRA